MAECSVTCYAGCRNADNTGPKVWRWLCECCAQECLDNHRRDTGHTDLNLSVTSEVTMPDLRRRIRRAGQVLIRQGW